MRVKRCHLRGADGDVPLHMLRPGVRSWHTVNLQICNPQHSMAAGCCLLGMGHWRGLAREALARENNKFSQWKWCSLLQPVFQQAPQMWAFAAQEHAEVLGPSEWW